MRRETGKFIIEAWEGYFIKDGKDDRPVECENALEYVKKLREEGFSTEQIDKLLPKLEEVAALKEEDRKELKERMEQLLPETKEEIAVRSEAETSFQRMYMGFGGAVTELLKQNNESLLQEMDERISNRILKEMNYLFRERENLEEERYRKLDRTIREYQAARQRTSLEEERKKRKFRFL